MTPKRGLPEGSAIRQCPGCGEAEAAWLVRIGQGKMACERCGAVFDPQTGAIEPEAADMVAPKDACPNCGERESDELVWLDDERVECQRCHTVYRPGAPAPDDGQTDASSA
ncbi:MAG: hypothetical protein HBSAPP02_28560 [Phycisphaerae bacterium]|nr:MAG: hypothetical protein HBSAPP02_28560 [Phycisphaerae bacterium]